MRRYLILFGSAVLVIMALVAAGNVLVDPYQMSGSTLLQRWAGLKPLFGDNHVLGKPFVVTRQQPQALVFGTSRENHGIDPMHSGWPVPSGRAYNLAMDAANMEQIERLFEHVSHVSKVSEVVIALDFLNMFDASVPGADNFDASLLVSDDHSAFAASLNAARYFVSWPMLRDSAQTLLHQDPGRIDFEPSGRRNALVFEGAAKRFGQHHMFEYSEAKYLRARLPLPPTRRYVPHDAAGPTLRHLARILDRATARGIQVRLFITPVHARQLEVYRTLGLWDALEQWKQGVVTTARGSGLRETSRVFPLWDFADYTELTSEPVPASGDTESRMQWYWESSHYRKPLGDLVLDRIFAKPGASIPDDFGVRLDSLADEAAVEAHLASIRAHGAAYRAAHPDDVADLQRLATQACPQPCQRAGGS